MRKTNQKKAFPQKNPSGPRHAALILLLVCVPLLFPRCAIKQLRMLSVVEEHYPPASKCGKCHVEIYKEWKKSDHAAGYSSESFRQATNDYAFQGCLGCHAPFSIHGPDEPLARNTSRNEGVTCVSCHIDQGVLTGPLDPTAAIVPHNVRVEKQFFKTSGLCGACHQGTFQEWKRADIKDKKNCQDCHMPEVTRKVTQATGFASRIFVSMEERHELRRHTFDYGSAALSADSKRAEEIVVFNVNWRRESGRFFAAVSVTNKLPHLIPTGDFGFRKGVLVMEGKTTQGGTAARETAEFFKEIKTALRPSAKRTFRFYLPGNVSRIELTLSRESDNGSNQIIIAKKSFVRPETIK